MPIGTNTEHRISGVHAQARAEPSKRESKKYQSRHTIPARGQAGADQEIVPIIGQIAGSYKGGAPGTFVLSQAPASPEAGPRPTRGFLQRSTRNWWLDHLTVWNGKTIVTEKPSLVIESDASTYGWGATCEGVRKYMSRIQWTNEGIEHVSCNNMQCELINCVHGTYRSYKPITRVSYRCTYL